MSRQNTVTSAPAVPSPDAGRKARGLSDGQIAEAADRYRSGESLRAIAGTFGVSVSTVHLALKAREVPRRPKVAPVLTEAQVQEILVRYRSGEGPLSLAQSYGVSYQALRRMLRSRGVPPLPRTGPRALSEAQIDEAVIRYRGGESVPSLAAAFEVGASTVRRALADRQVPQRTDQRILADTQADAVVARYQAGETTTALALAFGVSAGTITRALEARQVSRRRSGPARVLSDEQIDDMIDQYRTGASLAALARAYRVSPTTIRNALAARGVLSPRRGRRGRPDRSAVS